MTEDNALIGLTGPLKIEISGPCASGKSTLISAIRELLKGTKLADNILIVERQVTKETSAQWRVPSINSVDVISLKETY